MLRIQFLAVFGSFLAVFGVFGRFKAFLAGFGHFWLISTIFGPFLSIFGHFRPFLVHPVNSCHFLYQNAPYNQNHNGNLESKGPTHPETRLAKHATTLRKSDHSLRRTRSTVRSQHNDPDKNPRRSAIRELPKFKLPKRHGPGSECQPNGKSVRASQRSYPVDSCKRVRIVSKSPSS